MMQKQRAKGQRESVFNNEVVSRFELYPSMSDFSQASRRFFEKIPKREVRGIVLTLFGAGNEKL